MEEWEQILRSVSPLIFHYASGQTGKKGRTDTGARGENILVGVLFFIAIVIEGERGG